MNPVPVLQPPGFQLARLAEVLRELRRIDARCYRVLEMHMLRGRSLEQVAAALGLPLDEVARDWIKARAFVFVRCRDSTAPPARGEAPGA